MTRRELAELRTIEELLSVDALYSVASAGLHPIKRLQRVIELVRILVKQPDLSDVMYIVARAPHMVRLADALLERGQ